MLCEINLSSFSKSTSPFITLYPSKYFFNQLSEIKNKFPKIIKEIRGRGLMIGIQFFEEPTKFLTEFYNNKLITVKASDNVIRILPSLIVKKKEIDEGINIIHKTFKQ